MKNFTVLFICFFVAGILFSSTADCQTNTPNPNMWIPNGPINAIIVDGDYTYIGGAFVYVGPNTCFPQAIIHQK